MKSIPADSNKATRPEQIAQRLRREILEGAYKPGERLPAEREIASRLGVHRSSVREALKRLEGLRLVVIRRGDGTRVAPIAGASVELIRDLLLAGGRLDPILAEQILDVREMLIAGAAHLAVERGDDGTLEHARALVAVLGDPQTRDDTFLDAMESLFEVMARASGNLVLQLVRNAIHARLATRREVRLALRPPGPEVARAAREIDAALVSRDAAGLEEAVRRFLRASRARALNALEELASCPSGALPTAPEHPKPSLHD
ncbi:MAG TPA: GntR family transcriptional regulator [Myxococcota bacterium]|nr:GntR family transcriptional regulator [Myxococcota bacterium]